MADPTALQTTAGATGAPPPAGATGATGTLPPGATGTTGATGVTGASPSATGPTGTASGATGATGATAAAAPTVYATNSYGKKLTQAPDPNGDHQAYVKWLYDASIAGFSSDQINAASGGASGNTAGTGSNGAGTTLTDAGKAALGGGATGATGINQWTSDQSFIPTDDGMGGQHPTNWNVTPEQTVQGQMDSLTKNIGTNPVFQSLAEQLKRTQAASGGSNSLMAETAAYNQVVGLAFNIASADAATYAKSAEFNASMANQFGLAAQQFKNTALLSDQNYKQSQVLQAEQIQGNLASVQLQVAGQIEATGIAAGAQVQSANIGANASMSNAQLSATTSLKEADIQRQTTLDGLQIGFQTQWMLNQQGESNNLQNIYAQGGVNLVAQNNQIAGQLSIQHNADANANLRQLMGSISQIGATPGLTPGQQSNAVTQLTTMYNTNQSLSNSFYGAATNGLSNGSAVYSTTGVGSPTGATGQPQQNNPYSMFGNYMMYPGYEMTAPPGIPFYGGSGTTNVGKQPTPPPSVVSNDFLPPPKQYPAPPSSGTPQPRP